MWIALRCSYVGFCCCCFGICCFVCVFDFFCVVFCLFACFWRGVCFGLVWVFLMVFLSCKVWIMCSSKLIFKCTLQHATQFLTPQLPMGMKLREASSLCARFVLICSQGVARHALQTRSLEVLLNPPAQTQIEALLLCKEVSTKAADNVIWPSPPKQNCTTLSKSYE